MEDYHKQLEYLRQLYTALSDDYAKRSRGQASSYTPEQLVAATNGLTAVADRLERDIYTVNGQLPRTFANSLKAGETRSPTYGDALQRLFGVANREDLLAMMDRGIPQKYQVNLNDMSVDQLQNLLRQSRSNIPSIDTEYYRLSHRTTTLPSLEQYARDLEELRRIYTILNNDYKARSEGKASTSKLEQLLAAAHSLTTLSDALRAFFSATSSDGDDDPPGEGEEDAPQEGESEEGAPQQRQSPQRGTPRRQSPQQGPRSPQRQSPQRQSPQQGPRSPQRQSPQQGGQQGGQQCSQQGGEQGGMIRTLAHSVEAALKDLYAVAMSLVDTSIREELAKFIVKQQLSTEAMTSLQDMNLGQLRDIILDAGDAKFQNALDEARQKILSKYNEAPKTPRR